MITKGPQETFAVYYFIKYRWNLFHFRVVQMKKNRDKMQLLTTFHNLNFYPRKPLYLSNICQMKTFLKVVKRTKKNGSFLFSDAVAVFIYTSPQYPCITVKHKSNA